MKKSKALKKRIEDYEAILLQNFDDEIYATLLQEKIELEQKLEETKKDEKN